MDAKKRAGSVITTAVDGGVITFTVAGVGTLRLDTEAVSKEVRHAAMVHGFKQRVCDAAALSRDTTTGKAATAEAKFGEMEVIVGHYMTGTGEWNLKRSAGGGAEAGSMVIRAAAELQRVDVAVMKGRLSALAAKRGVEVKAILAELGKTPAVIRRVAEIKAAAASAAGVDGDSMLAELDGAEG